MTYTSKAVLISIATLALIASGSEASQAGDQTNHAHTDHGTMDHGDMNHQMKAGGDTGHSTGTVVSISPDGRNITINHKAIEGVNMGAMTMGFGLTSNVSLNGLSAGDPVSFMVKRGRDNGYRVTAICNTATQGADCLKAHMNHR